MHPRNKHQQCFLNIAVQVQWERETDRQVYSADASLIINCSTCEAINAHLIIVKVSRCYVMSFY